MKDGPGPVTGLRARAVRAGRKRRRTFGNESLWRGSPGPGSWRPRRGCQTSLVVPAGGRFRRSRARPGLPLRAAFGSFLEGSRFHSSWKDAISGVSPRNPLKFLFNRTRPALTFSRAAPARSPSRSQPPGPATRPAAASASGVPRSSPRHAAALQLNLFIEVNNFIYQLSTCLAATGLRQWGTGTPSPPPPRPCSLACMGLAEPLGWRPPVRPRAAHPQPASSLRAFREASPLPLEWQPGGAARGGRDSGGGGPHPSARRTARK